MLKVDRKKCDKEKWAETIKVTDKNSLEAVAAGVEPLWTVLSPYGAEGGKRQAKIWPILGHEWILISFQFALRRIDEPGDSFPFFVNPNSSVELFCFIMHQWNWWKCL